MIARLMGGLGNQLFQYAAGRRLARARGAELKLDASGLAAAGLATPRRYELGALNVAAGLASPEEVAALRDPRAPGLLDRLRRRPPGAPASRVRERHFHFDPGVLDLPDGVYLDGYWQSERYFADVADLIRKETAPTAPLAGRNAETAREIEGCEAVSVHVRRGDYVDDARTREVHGPLGADYYARAAAHVAERLSSPVFFAFSDDPDWVRAHLDLPGPVTVVDHNGPEHPAEDLRLMALCRHHVTANSSFSWWGAWLDPRPGKTVVAPARWFGGDPADTRDLCPAEWVRL